MKLTPRLTLIFIAYASGLLLGAGLLAYNSGREALRAATISELQAGQKSYVTGGSEADFINTLVQFEGQGPALVVIDTHLPGVELTRRFGSIDGSHHAAFRFSGVRVPASHVIGKPGEGLPRALRQIGDTRLLIAAQCVGLMRWVIDYVTTHLRAPDRSGRPRGDKEGIRLRYADLRIGAFAARNMLYRTARLADAGENVVNEAIACKVHATEEVGKLVDTAIKLVGGNAVTDDHPLSILYRQVRRIIRSIWSEA